MKLGYKGGLVSLSLTKFLTDQSQSAFNDTTSELVFVNVEETIFFGNFLKKMSYGANIIDFLF